ncbi:hypothetical protein RhiirA5_346520 [Rhizophagus irregularis]|uniref:Uncharacterized protein n=3 Tax=Rhizophagus irregularis TaxID=588596 RepID=U9TXN4_RHIID|nr:hypothetical protein GLOIN_2v1556119 [Rhizophagus irregularis DAOM 181602=DAOM 197198]EXX76122.1 hypothetical protein RirG_036090 [Rhizophagus irregularis DAOM 197198w]PKC17308.1 hypothetical protein RhiirA5_346520 [Rhizophagus irregularis]PKC74285.1 hypothetical protein RhiirA1_409451 [Rhizophagus irregularis]PKK79514.1 hypothetical protein RhiirC2_727020 [Rhizophagus irregularis]PKY15517.1 hypothetical protein RhiirB3_401725 [Rhizophagus irregularis]|eukprot:XP_025183288.1 hypothetical protein GLOIN_2v1556119 [Rhizophagus irregularis DAOM 181602=DAOM 197198]
MSYKYEIIDKRQLTSTAEDEDSPSTTPAVSEPQSPTGPIQFATLVVTSEKPASTITETESSTITTTVKYVSADASNTPSNSTSVLLAALLGTIGLIIILTGLLFMILWLKRGEKPRVINRGLTQLDDNGSLNDSNDSTNDEMVTYRPSDPDDEQLPSYAEAVVRGRSSTIYNNPVI